MANEDNVQKPLLTRVAETSTIRSDEAVLQAGQMAVELTDEFLDGNYEAASETNEEPLLTRPLIVPIIDAKKRWDESHSMWDWEIYEGLRKSLVMVYGEEQVEMSIKHYWDDKTPVWDGLL